MKVDTKALVSATDLNRNSGQLISRAADGERLVILNQNRPVAAIVPICDLHRLEAIDEAAAEATALVGGAHPTPKEFRDLAARPGYTAIGETSPGEIVELELACNTWVVAKANADLIYLVSAVLNGATGNGPAVQFAVATTELAAPVNYHHLDPEAAPPPITTLATDVADDEESAGQFVSAVRDQMQKRTTLLKELGLASIEELRRTRPEESALFADLIVVVRATCSITNPGLSNLVASIVSDKGQALAVYVWIFEAESNVQLAPYSYQFPQSCAMRMSHAALARRVVGSDAPVRLPRWGQAYITSQEQGSTALQPNILVHLAERDNAGASRFATDPSVACKSPAAPRIRA